MLQPHKDLERLKLQGQLLSIDAERRKLFLKEQEDLLQSSQKLLSLLEKLGQLTLEDED